MRLKKKQSKKDTNQKSSKKKENYKHIKFSIPLEFDEKMDCYKDNEENYIGMVGLSGVNLYSFSTEDQNSYIRILEGVISTLARGQIYACEVPANIEGYIEDIERLQKELNFLSSHQDKQKWNILEEEKRELYAMSDDMNFVDKKYVIVLKDDNYYNLQRILKDVASQLYAYSNASVLSVKEQTALIYNFYRKGNYIYFNNFYDVSKKDNIMDLIYPDNINLLNPIKPIVCIDGYYSKTKYVAKWLDQPSFAFLSEIANIEGVDFSLHFEVDNENSMKEQLDKNAKNLESQIDVAKHRSEEKDIQEKYKINDDLLDDIVKETTAPLYMRVAIRYSAESLDELKIIEKDIDRLLKRSNVILRDAPFLTLELMNSVAPIAYNSSQLEYCYNQSTAETIAYMYPFCFESMYDSQPVYDNEKNIIGYRPPIYIGNTTSSGGPVFYDNHLKNYKDRTSFNEIITGQTGSGKTTLMMYFIMLRYARGFKQFILDVDEKKELSKLTHYLNGVNIDCSSCRNGGINPLQVRISIPESDDADEAVELKNIYPVDQHIRFLEDWLMMYRGKTSDDFQDIISLIKEVIFEEYEKIGITSETTAEELLNDYTNESYPVFRDIYDGLVVKKKEAKAAGETKREEDFEIAIRFVRSLAIGENASVFNTKTTVDLDNDLICFNLHNLSTSGGSRVVNVQYYNVLTFIKSYVISANEKQRRIQIYTDEQHNFIDADFLMVVKFLDVFVRQDRKYHCGLTSATQEIDDYYKPSVKEFSSVIFKQSIYKFFFSTGGTDTTILSELASIPNSEIEFIKYASMGECFMKAGIQTSLQVDVIIPDYFLNILNDIKKN